nr:MAG TPA: hypothetical protein [Crassvirales sp.]
MQMHHWTFCSLSQDNLLQELLWFFISLLSLRKPSNYKLHTFTPTLEGC